MLARTLQLQLHLPMFLIVFPVNAIIFIEGMMTVVKFDVMEYIWQWYQYAFWGKNQLLSPNVSNQIIDIGYDDRNAFIALIDQLIYFK